MFVEEKTQGEITEAPSKMLKLSALIREGAALLPQTRKTYYDGVGTCAIGAAFHAAHGYPSASMQVCHWIDGWPRGATYVFTEIFARNDAGESREAIADWLEAQGF